MAMLTGAMHVTEVDMMNPMQQQRVEVFTQPKRTARSHVGPIEPFRQQEIVVRRRLLQRGKAFLRDSAHLEGTRRRVQVQALEPQRPHVHEDGKVLRVEGVAQKALRQGHLVGVVAVE